MFVRHLHVAEMYKMIQIRHVPAALRWRQKDRVALAEALGCSLLTREERLARAPGHRAEVVRL